MCRWVAYNGKPIFIEDLVTQPEHSLVEQSIQVKDEYRIEGSLWNTNADGFGIGWYGEKDEPALFKDATPAWNDINLKEICANVKTPTFLAHIRRTTTGAVQRSNSHPFKHGKWLFQHNGHVRDFEVLMRDLQIDVDVNLFSEIKGTTDSETFFYLALTYGLDKNPKEALQKMVQRIEKACMDHGGEICLNLSCAMTDGQKLYTIRYANGDPPNTQFYSTEAKSAEDLGGLSVKIPAKSVIVVSEPLNELGTMWEEVPPNSFCTIENGAVSIETFMD